MSKLIRTVNVIVEFTRVDITTEYGVSPSNITSKIGNFIKEYSKPYSYKASDYLEVIHIIDKNKRKVENVKKLLSLPKVWGCIPYDVYFFLAIWSMCYIKEKTH